MADAYHVCAALDTVAKLPFHIVLLAALCCVNLNLFIYLFSPSSHLYDIGHVSHIIHQITILFKFQLRNIKLIN